MKKSMNDIGRFAFLEDMAMRVFSDLRKVDASSLDGASADCFKEALEVSRIMKDVLRDRTTWEEGRERLMSLLYGEEDEKDEEEDEDEEDW